MPLRKLWKLPGLRTFLISALATIMSFSRKDQLFLFIVIFPKYITWGVLVNLSFGLRERLFLVLAPPLKSCLILGKLVYLPNPHFPHLLDENGGQTVLTSHLLCEEIR